MSKKAAKQLIDRISKAKEIKVCLAPHAGVDCHPRIIRAHTLSKQSALQPISKGGHVFVPEMNLWEPDYDSVLAFKKKGVNKTSVFFGFCQKHDKELFSCIEDKVFTGTAEQCFAYAYRAVAWEVYAKRAHKSLALPPIDLLKQVQGIPEELEVEYSPEMLRAASAAERGSQDVERTLRRMIAAFSSGMPEKLKSTIYWFKPALPLVCSSAFAPMIDLSGNRLQDFGDFDADLEPLVVNIVPFQNESAVILTRFQHTSPAVEQFVESFEREPDVASALIWIVFCSFENAGLSPDWWLPLSKETKAEILSASRSSTDPFDPTVDLIARRSLSFDGWTLDRIQGL